VTVRADDIALVGLSENPLDARAADHASDALNLRLGIAMIELHGANGKSAPAVETGHVAQLIEEIGVPSPLCSVVLDPF
jgi:hypothetical protein